MARVTPTQVVRTIDALFKHLPLHQGTELNASLMAQLQGVLDLVQEIPSELIDVPEERFADFTLGVGSIRVQIARWIAAGPNYSTPQLGIVSPVLGRNAVSVIRDVLLQCPDSFPPRAAQDLSFITDQDLRASIRQDIGDAQRAFQNAEWKAATVLAGASIEALLLWRLSDPPRTPSELKRAGEEAVAARKLSRQPKANLNEWDLCDYIWVAHGLQIIKDVTAAQADVAREFRNLIHPGRAARKGIVCHRGTAHSALGGVDHVVSDLTP
jgi:hypothetical protein